MVGWRPSTENLMNYLYFRVVAAFGAGFSGQRRLLTRDSKPRECVSQIENILEFIVSSVSAADIHVCWAVRRRLPSGDILPLNSCSRFGSN